MSEGGLEPPRLIQQTDFKSGGVTVIVFFIHFMVRENT